MGRSRLLASVLSAGALAAASLVAGPSAQAAGPAQEWRPADISYAKIVKVEKTHAHVVARYRCFGGNNERTHVWVSIKQGPKITAMPLKELIASEGTSQISKAWYNSNIPAPGSEPIALTANCDGRWHRDSYKIYRQLELTNADGTTRSLGKLRTGRVFLQYCLIDSFANPDDQSDPTGVNWKYSKPWITVRHHHHD